jgi:hypothetical protein
MTKTTFQKYHLPTDFHRTKEEGKDFSQNEAGQDVRAKHIWPDLRARANHSLGTNARSRWFGTQLKLSYHHGRIKGVSTERFERRPSGKVYFTSMKARSGSWVVKREGMEGVLMKENENLCNRWSKGRFCSDHS